MSKLAIKNKGQSTLTEGRQLLSFSALCRKILQKLLLYEVIEDSRAKNAFQKTNNGGNSFKCYTIFPDII